MSRSFSFTLSFDLLNHLLFLRMCILFLAFFVLLFIKGEKLNVNVHWDSIFMIHNRWIACFSFLTFLMICRTSHRRCPAKQCVLKTFPNFTGKHLCWSLILVKFQAFWSKRLQQWCFCVKFRKFLRTPILKKICCWLPLNLKRKEHIWKYKTKCFCKGWFPIL